jgi:hypothetical protein
MGRVVVVVICGGSGGGGGGGSGGDNDYDDNDNSDGGDGGSGGSRMGQVSVGVRSTVHTSNGDIIGVSSRGSPLSSSGASMLSGPSSGLRIGGADIVRACLAAALNAAPASP